MRLSLVSSSAPSHGPPCTVWWEPDLRLMDTGSPSKEVQCSSKCHHDLRAVGSGSPSSEPRRSIEGLPWISLEKGERISGGPVCCAPFRGWHRPDVPLPSLTAVPPRPRPYGVVVCGAGVAVGLGLGGVVALGLARAAVGARGAEAVAGVRVMPVTSPLTVSFCFLDDVGIGRLRDPPPRCRMRTARGIDVQLVVGRRR